MAEIKVGVEGWAGLEPADSLATMIGMRKIRWVEINGMRLDDGTLVSVSGNWTGTGFHVTEISLIGLPEFVYLGKDGSELA